MSEESNQLRVRLVTPERTLFERDATAVELPAKVRLHGSPLRTRAADGRAWRGDVIVHGAASNQKATALTDDPRYNVSWGFVEVLPNRVTILASDALKPEEIDVARAEQQLDRGLKLWKEAGESEEPTTRLSASSPKPKPRWPPPPKSISNNAFPMFHPLANWRLQRCAEFPCQFPAIY